MVKKINRNAIIFIVMDEIIKKAYELKTLLEEDNRVLSLNLLEETMKNDEEAIRLSYKKDLAIDDYEFALNHFDKNSKEVDKAQKALYEAKLKLDKCESVANYLKAYSEVRDLYLKINNILFSFINMKACEGEKD